MRFYDFTKGNIRTQLIRFSIPFFLTSLIQSTYNIADIKIVGKYLGNPGIAATSIAGNLTWSLTYGSIALCDGGAIMVSQYVGRKSGGDVKETVSTVFALSLLLAAASTALFILLAGPLLRLLNTPQKVFDDACDYFRICTAGSVFVFGYNAMASLLRGMGDSRTPMYFGVASCLINIVLDIIFVGTWDMKVAGAAYATVISQALSMFGFAAYLYLTRSGVDVRPSTFKLNKTKALAILKLGLPGTVQSFVVSGGFLVVSALTNSLGVSAASGVAVAGKINNVCQMPAVAIGSAASAMTGQNVGGRDYDRARAVLKNAIKISLTIGAAAFILVQLFTMPLLKLLAEEKDVLLQGRDYLKITSLDYIMTAFVFPLNALCNGSGHTMFTMIPSIVSSVVVRVPVAYFCVKVLALKIIGVGLATPTGTLSAIIICTWFYLSNRWCESTIA
ncbi:MAG: MATE family efflux transporter [Clostridia bacterium]|nr:MATE family efflux transporter [Clostridia bacterium]